MDKPSVERLREMFAYDEATGIITWRKKPNRRIKIGVRAGAIRPDSYYDMSLDGAHFLLHQAAWALATGHWPADLIDHRNGVRTDNRLANLREADHSINAQNQRGTPRSATGFRGVTLDKRRGVFNSQIFLRGRRHYLGAFATPESAGAAYDAAKPVIHAEGVT